MKLESSPKIFDGYKSDYPENTIRKIETGLKEIGLKLKYKEIKIKSAGFSSYSGDLFLEDFGFKTTGKGISKILAKASAYAEMAERISSGFVFYYTLNSDFEKYHEILKNVINRKFLKGHTINKNNSLISLEKINDFLQKNIEIEQYKFLKKNNIFDILIDCYSVLNNNTLKIPINFIELSSGSNGLAAGNTYEEAISQGSCEIFERYVACKIVSEKITCPTVDIDTIDDERIYNFVEMLNSLNIEVIIKDFTLNNRFPVMGILFINHNIEKDDNPIKKDRYYKMINPGSHLNLNEAILRCLVERLQEVSKEELMFRKNADILYKFWTSDIKGQCKKIKKNFKHFFKQFYYYGDLSFLEKGSLMSFNKLKSIHYDDFFKEIEYIKKICLREKWDLALVDCKHKTLNFPVVRVIIPPISIDSNPYVRSFLKSKNIKEQFNFLYEIKDFDKYIYGNRWLNNSKLIDKLIKNIENFLSTDLFSFEMELKRGPFYKIINLFHVLAFCNLAIEKYDKSLKYFKFLEKQRKKNHLKIKYFNKLYNPTFDDSLYSNYIKKINKNNCRLDYNFSKNPFFDDKKEDISDLRINKLLEKFSKSYFKK